MIRTDILHDRKCIHVKLKKDVHLKLREKLFAYQLSIQAVFDEFAHHIVNDERKALKFLEDLAVKRAQAELDKPTKSRIIATKERVDELDHNTLYNMINAEETRARTRKNST